MKVTVCFDGKFIGTENLCRTYNKPLPGYIYGISIESLCFEC